MEQHDLVASRGLFGELCSDAADNRNQLLYIILIRVDNIYFGSIIVRLGALTLDTNLKRADPYYAVSWYLVRMKGKYPFIIQIGKVYAIKICYVEDILSVGYLCVLFAYDLIMGIR